MNALCLRRGDVLVYVVLSIAAAVVVAPVIWVIAAGFRTQISLLMGQFFFTPVLMNFAEVLFSKTSDYLINYRNSLFVGVASTALCVRRRRWRPGRSTACAGRAGWSTSFSAGRWSST